MNYKNMLIAFSNEKEDTGVVQSAIDLAHKYNAKITLLHINTDMAGKPSRVMHVMEHRYTEEELREIINKHNPHQIKVDIKIVQSNDIVGTIVSESKSVDLVIMGHENLNFFEMMISDTTDEKVINKIHCHCLVVNRS